VQHVLARVVDLLVAQRAGVPAGEARALAQPHAEQLGDERLVAELRAQPCEARGELRVEDVAHLGVPRALEQRDVLARGVQHQLDAGVGEHLGERGGIHGVVERVDDRDEELAAALDRHLHEAQQRLVAPLAHELRVDAQPARVAGCRREFGDVG
jgi:hypothetical protein